MFAPHEGLKVIEATDFKNVSSVLTEW